MIKAGSGSSYADRTGTATFVSHSMRSVSPARDPQVTRRLAAALADLVAVVPPERRAALDRQLRLLGAAVRRHYDDEDDANAALVPDPQGIGSGPDVSDHSFDDATAGPASSVGRTDT